MVLAYSVAAAVAAALLLHAVVLLTLRKASKRLLVAKVAVERTRRSARTALVVIAVASAWSGQTPGVSWSGTVSHTLSILVIATLAWLAISVLVAIEDYSFTRLTGTDQPADLRARKVKTQIVVLRRVTVVVVLVIAVAAALLTFHGVRVVGTSLLASAGLIGIIAAAAARPSLANIAAGIQIAVTEPIRLDDIVVVQGTYGRIEEITLTYVVLRVWDDRRMVLPISYFVTNSFESWTRSSSALTGEVLVYLDYRAPIDEIRQAVDGILGGLPDWDGRVKAVQVTNATEITLELRVLVSAVDAGTLFNLRCEVREQLLAWVREHHPEALPTHRLALDAIFPSIEAASPEIGAPGTRSATASPAASDATTHGTS